MSPKIERPAWSPFAELAYARARRAYGSEDRRGTEVRSEGCLRSSVRPRKIGKDPAAVRVAWANVAADCYLRGGR